LASQIKAGEYELLAATLDAMFGRLSSNRQDGFLYGQNIALQITLLSGQLLLELGISSPEFVAKEKELWQQFLAKETLVELLSLLEEYLKEVCTLIREKRNGKSRDLVERVQAIVEQCYAENLTVVDIGRKVYLTPTYVSLLYKQETGKTITDYLTHVRMEKAKEMLRDPRTKFYDVCTSVGYADPSYFTKLFKKVVGMTPSTYREQLGKGG
jgi:two-component system response regulator YesN